MYCNVNVFQWWQNIFSMNFQHDYFSLQCHLRKTLELNIIVFLNKCIYFKELEHNSYLQNFISLSSYKPLRVFLKGCLLHHGSIWDLQISCIRINLIRTSCRRFFGTRASGHTWPGSPHNPPPSDSALQSPK